MIACSWRPVLSERRMFMMAVTPELFASWKFAVIRKGTQEIAASGASSPGRVLCCQMTNRSYRGLLLSELKIDKIHNRPQQHRNRAPNQSKVVAA